MIGTSKLWGSAAALALAFGTVPAQAQTAIKFTLDWVFQGPTSPFLVALEKGYYKAEGLDVTMDPGQGSAGAVQRVATGAYQIGFADVNSTIEYNAKNPGKEILCVFMAYDFAPFGVYALKKSGIKVPKDLEGKKLGAPVFDAGRRGFPIFQKANGIGAVNWISMDPPLRETMLVRGDVDAITGFYFTSLLNLEARGVKAEDLAVQLFPQFGVKLYGNAIIASEEFLKKNPEAVKAFLRAFAKGARQVIADPKAATAVVKERDGIINAELEERRLRLAIDSAIATPDAKTEGFGAVSGPRLALMASQVADAYATKSRVNPDAIWNASFLPSAADRDIFAAAKRPAKK